MKQTRSIKDLRGWDKNPRRISEPDFERLKKQIVKLGQYKPLVITQDGEVLGGNMRLRAYRELGIERAWVSVVEAHDEKTKLEYALSDNDRAGEYDDEGLAELILSVPDLELGDFKVDVGKLTDLGDLVDRFQPSENDFNEEKKTESPPRQVKCPECGSQFEI